MILFVDSAAHIALVDPRDQHHSRATAFLRGIQGIKLVTSMFVMSEVATRAGQLVAARSAAGYVRAVLSNPLYHILNATRDLFIQGLDALVKYEDQGLSLTDCTSLLIMRGGHIRTIFTFDDAFRRMGFETVP